MRKKILITVLAAGLLLGAASLALSTYYDVFGTNGLLDTLTLRGSYSVQMQGNDQTTSGALLSVPDFTDATADFLVTNAFRTSWAAFGGLAGEDTDGAGTNGAGLVLGNPDLSTHQYNNSTGNVIVKVYDNGTTTWEDLAASSNLAGWAADDQLTPDAASEASGDAFAIGFSTNFAEAAFNDLATGAGALATWSNDGGKWQYSTGAGTWSDLTVYDGTDSTANDGKRPLQQAGAVSFAPPSDWASVTIDAEEGYFIQWVFTAATLTQAALIDGTNLDEPFVVVADTDALEAPFKASISQVRVTDMGGTVHDQIIKFVVGNMTDGVYSAELSWAASQLSDSFDLASDLAVDADDLIGIIVTDDAGSTNNPVWAVEFEVTYED